MKRKPITVLMLILLVLSLAAIPAGAVDMVEPVGTVYAPKVTTPPTLDGVIARPTATRICIISTSACSPLSAFPAETM